MPNEDRVSPSSELGRLLSIVLNAPWLQSLAEAWKVRRKLWRGLADEEMYEVLDYESTLELQDKHGERAIFHKREKVSYLQDNIIAYQDQAWADGESLLNYRCTPGVPVDRYQPGRDTYILSSLREVKNIVAVPLLFVNPFEIPVSGPFGAWALADGRGQDIL